VRRHLAFFFRVGRCVGPSYSHVRAHEGRQKNKYL
jgi:hypothetical protein